MNRTRMRTIVVALVCSALTIGVVDTAFAPPTSSRIVDAKVTPQQGGNASYTGKVKSKKGRCYKNRLVQIFHKGVKIGETRTDGDGRFQTFGPLPPRGDQVTFKIEPQKGCRGDSVQRTAP